MSGFDAYGGQDGITESELAALHLGELPAGRARQVRRALGKNGALAAESAAIAATLAMFADTPLVVDKAMADRNWRALRPLLAAHARPAPAGGRWWKPLALGAVAASLAVGVFFVFGHALPKADAPVEMGEARPVGQPGIGLRRPGPGANGVGAGAAPAGPGLSHGGNGAANMYADVFRSENGRSPVHELALAPLPGGGAEPERGPMTGYPLTTAPVTSVPLTSVPLTDGTLTTGPLTSVPVTRDAGVSLAASGLPVAKGVPAGLEGVGGNPRRPLDPATGTGKKHAGHTTDGSLAMGGSFIPPHHSTVAAIEPASQSNTNSVVALGSFHQQYRPGVGYRVTASYTRTSFQYTYLGAGSSINSRIFEIAGTYVVEGPHHGRVSSTGDVGGGLMAFLPTSDPNASYVYRGAAVLGASVDVALTKHVSVRGAYRAQLFKGPDFRYSGGTVPVMVSLRESNETSLGIVYGFGKR